MTYDIKKDEIIFILFLLIDDLKLPVYLASRNRGCLLIYTLYKITIILMDTNKGENNDAYHKVINERKKKQISDECLSSKHTVVSRVYRY